jgi:hypothetical protein
MKTIKKAISVTLMASMVFGCGTDDGDPVIDPPMKDDPFSLEMLEALIDRSNLVNPTETFRDVIDPINGDVTVGASLLLRDENGVALSLKSSQRKGHTAIILMVVWNFPENCIVPGACTEEDFRTEEVSADGLVVAGAEISEEGIGSFSGYLKEGDITGSMFPTELGLPAVGLIDAQTAQVTFVVHSNGPKIPGQVEDQISLFEGGCTLRLLPNFTKIPNAEGECGAIQMSIH